MVRTSGTKRSVVKDNIFLDMLGVYRVLKNDLLNLMQFGGVLVYMLQLSCYIIFVHIRK